MQARHEITPLLGKAKLTDIRLGPCQRLGYLALITSKSPYRSIAPASQKTVSPNTYQLCVKTASNSVHRSWQRAAPCPVRSDAYFITCAMGPRRAGWPLTALDGLINHGHLLDSCSGTVINGFVDWAMQQTLLHLLKQQSHTAKGTGFTHQQTGEIAESCPKLPSSLRACRVTPSSALEFKLPATGSSQAVSTPIEGQPWYQLLSSCGDAMERLAPTNTSPLQDVMPWPPPCPLPGTLMLSWSHVCLLHL